MSSNVPRPESRKTIFVDQDYKKIIGSSANIIARGRLEIEYELEKDEDSDSDSQKIDFFDLSDTIKKLEKTKKIYFRDESGEKVGLLKKQPRYIANQVYRLIGKTICTEYLGMPPKDFQKKMGKLASGLTEVELLLEDEIVSCIKLGGEYEEAEEAEVDKGDSVKKTSLPN